MSETTLRLAVEHAARWSSYGGIDADPAEAAALAQAQNLRLDELCHERGRDPRSLVRSVLLGYLWVREAPWRSEEAFLEVVERWRGAGMDEIVFVYPPWAAMPKGAVTDGVFEHAAETLMPALASPRGLTPL
jgi:hypothetical protein